jgi:N utilization substance protein B
VPKVVAKLDESIAPQLDRSLDDLTPVELSILRLATYEMIHRIDVPYRVVINEAIELTKMFGATDAHKYVNGVMDKIAQQTRLVEVSNNTQEKTSQGRKKDFSHTPKIQYKKSIKISYKSK